MGGRLRFTEQGESVTNRYADPTLARRHLEQLVHAVLVAGGRRPVRHARRAAAPGRPRSTSCRRSRSGPTARSCTSGRSSSATCTRRRRSTRSTGSTSAAGLRGARRQRGLADLRAIPWVFAWTQSRVALPGWYGLGSALAGWAGDDDERWALLGTMYREWTFFKTLVDNAQLALRGADMLIAARLRDARGRARSRGRLPASSRPSTGAPSRRSAASRARRTCSTRRPGCSARSACATPTSTR